MRCGGTSGDDVEVFDVDFGYVALDLVFVLPRTSAQFAFDEEHDSLADVSFSDFGVFPPHDDVVPFGFFGDCDACLVCVGSFVSCEGERCYGLSRSGITDVGVASDISDEDDFVYRHGFRSN